MTETVPASKDETKKDSPQSSPKPKSKPSKQTNDGNERSKATEKVEKPPTKVVVRRLPPTMTLETFLDQVAPLPPVDYMYFVKADASLAPNSFARAYLHFVHVADLLIFTEKFDNYVFVDSKGNEYPAIVEYAPFQRIPKQRSTRKKDSRIGTIENDPYYQDFFEALKAEESQRKSASKTNKQHFFETSTGNVVPKVTSTPLLEFLKARRADKLKSKEDKIAERRKRETERRKAREDSRPSIKQIKSSEGQGDPTPQLKIAGHGSAADRVSKEVSDIKRFSKDVGQKDTVSKRREEERVKGKERERKDREKETRETQRDVKRDIRKDNGKEQNHDKENLPSAAESKPKDRRGGKSYQEERQRLNERRLAAKGMVPKSSTGDGDDKFEKMDDTSVHEDVSADKGFSAKKDGSEPRNNPHEKFRGPDQPRLQGNRETRKYEKPSKTSRDQEQRRPYEQQKSYDDRHSDGKEAKKSTISDKSTSNYHKSEDGGKLHVVKEETRKKSYNQEREQRRAAAADRKNQTRRDSAQGNVDPNGDDDPKESTKQSDGKQNTEGSKVEKGSRHSVDSRQDEASKSRSNSKTVSSGGSSDTRKKDGSTSREEKDKKDPRSERRIRNKDRPSIEIYRPGMGRFSKQRLERQKELTKGSSTERDSPSPSPSPVPSCSKTGVISEKADE